MKGTFSLVFLVCVPSLLWAQTRPTMAPGDEPPALMRKVFAMRDKVKFTGVRIVQHLEKGERQFVKERIFRDGVRVRIETMDGPKSGQIAVENNETRRVWSSSDNTIREMPARESEFFMRLGKMGGRPSEGRKLRERPILQESDGGIVAGVSTRLLEFKTPDGKVMSQTWIDPVHGVILKFQNLDQKGIRNGFLEFKSIKFDTQIAANNFVIDKPDARLITPGDELKQFARDLGFKPYRLPQSSSWRLVSVRKMEPKGTKVLMQIYKNQRNQVSLFVIHGNLNEERLKHLQGGRTNTHVWDRDGVRMVLIGNLEPEGLLRLAGSVID